MQELSGAAVYACLHMEPMSTKPWVVAHTQDLQQVNLQQLGQQLHCLWTMQL